MVTWPTFFNSNNAFEKLFQPFGEKISKRVKIHHEHNGGLSRFEKIPLYLSWTDQKISKEIIEKLCKRFSSLVFNGVINSKWIPGVENLIKINPFNQIFTLVTATPQKEIEKILDKLNNLCHLLSWYLNNLLPEKPKLLG